MSHPRAALAELQAGELDDDASAKARSHLDRCDECRNSFASLGRAMTALQMPEPWRDPPALRPSSVRSPIGSVAVTFGVLVILAVVAVAAPRPRDTAAATAPPQPSVTGQPTPVPQPTPWPAHSSDEVTANIQHDPNFALAVAALTTGVNADPRAVGKTVQVATPLSVRALEPADASEYLVPLTIDDRVVAIVQVAVDAQGNGRVVASRGWSSAPSFPAISADEARTLAAAHGESPVRTELVWAPIRGQADELEPFWRIVLSNGRLVYVFEDGTLAPASEFGLE